MRDVARAMWARGRLAELETRYSDAANGYRQAIELGYRIRREGLLVDALVGMACSGYGIDSLYHVRHKLPLDDLDRSIATLIRLNADDETYDNVWQRDRVWTQRASGWHGHLQQLLSELVDHVYEFFIRSDQYAANYRTHQATVRLLIVELALVRFREDHGRLPDSLTELTPDYLTAIPTDPFDPIAESLRFKRDGAAYVLYSIGPNGIDESGKAPDQDDPHGFPQTGDVRLDLYFAKEDASATATQPAGAATGSETRP